MVYKRSPIILFSQFTTQLSSFSTAINNLSIDSRNFYRSIKMYKATTLLAIAVVAGSAYGEYTTFLARRSKV